MSTTYKEKQQIKFSNGEIWIIAKGGIKWDCIRMTPFNDIAKKNNLSLEVPFEIEEVEEGEALN